MDFCGSGALIAADAEEAGGQGGDSVPGWLQAAPFPHRICAAMQTELRRAGKLLRVGAVRCLLPRVRNER